MIADPLLIQKVLEQLMGKSDGLLAKVERVAALCTDARQVKVTLETIRKQAASHRCKGSSSSRLAATPTAPLPAARRPRPKSSRPCATVIPSQARRNSPKPRAFAQEAQSTIDQVQKARSACEREPAARSRETQRLRTALAQAESYQTELERDFASSSWTSVARNIEQARALLATFDRQIQDSAAAASSSSQEYLKGARLLEELARQQQIVLRLMSGLGEQLNSLIAVRNESRSLIDKLAASERQAEQLFGENQRLIGDLARESLAKAQQLRQEILLRSARNRPDWPGLRQSLAEAIEEMSIAQAQAQEDIKNFELLTTEFEAARRTASRVYALLESHREDRLAANQRYQSAADALDRLAMEMEDPRAGAAALLAQVRDAAADLEQAEQLARQDIQLAAQAQAEIDKAADALRQAQSYQGMGVSVDMSSAGSQLMQAEQLVRSQNYEQAIQIAGAAAQLARRVSYAAAQQAMMRQMAEMAEQRRRAARMAAPAWGDGISFGSAAATAAAATILENAASSPPAPAPPAPAPAHRPRAGNGRRLVGA